MLCGGVSTAMLCCVLMLVVCITQLETITNIEFDRRRRASPVPGRQEASLCSTTQLVAGWCVVALPGVRGGQGDLCARSPDNYFDHNYTEYISHSTLFTSHHYTRRKPRVVQRRDETIQSLLAVSSARSDTPPTCTSKYRSYIKVRSTQFKCIVPRSGGFCAPRWHRIGG